MKKYLWCAGLTVLLCSLLALCLRGEAGQKPEENLPAFRVRAPGGDICIPLWVKDGDGFVFLPSFAELAETEAEPGGADGVFLNEAELTDGMSCGGFELNTAYELRIGDREPLQLRFLKSSGVAAMCIDTASGSMEAIHADKSHRERAELRILMPDGSSAFAAPLAVQLRGHGNSTWELDKKSYNLYLGIPTDLFGMGEAEKYVLVSNAIDDTNLRNRIVYGFAGDVAGYAGFSPECEYVDLYLNGSYAGLYLLCEKPEISGSRLDVDAGSILFEVTAYDPNDAEQSFELNEGLYVEIHAPDPCPAGRKAQLEARLRRLQEVLLAGDGTAEDGGEDWAAYLDADSWARKYLVEEVFENADAGFFSQYYYCLPTSELIYAGPCWDYDGSIGMFTEHAPVCFLAQREYLNATLYNPWYAALWRKADFADLVKALYRTDFVPELNRLTAVTLPELEARLHDASEMNRIRWYGADTDLSTSIREVEDFLRARIAFLNAAWLDGVPYHTVTLKRTPGATWLYYCIPDGESCAELPTPETFGLEGADWYRESDGTRFDVSTVLTGDLTLTAYDPLADGQDGG